MSKRSPSYDLFAEPLQMLRLVFSQHVERNKGRPVTHVSHILPVVAVTSQQNLDCDLLAAMLALQHFRKSTAVHYNTHRIIVQLEMQRPGKQGVAGTHLVQ